MQVRHGCVLLLVVRIAVRIKVLHAVVSLLTFHFSLPKLFNTTYLVSSLSSDFFAITPASKVDITGADLRVDRLVSFFWAHIIILRTVGIKPADWTICFSFGLLCS